MSNIAFLPIAPEIVLFSAALILLLGHVTFGWGVRIWGWISGAGFVAAIALSWAQWLRIDELGGGTLHFAFRGTNHGESLTPAIVMDHFSSFAGLLIFAVAGLAMMAGWELVRSFERRGAEFIALALIAVSGMHLMTVSANLITLFIGLEAASIALYVLAGFDRTGSHSDEASIKYFLMGSFASALFVYGVALAFAAFGSTSLYGAGSIATPVVDSIREFDVAASVSSEPGLMLVAVALLIVGLGFKVSAAPFHQWAPDVYQGAPGGVIGLMAAGVKVAGFAAMARILVGALDISVAKESWSHGLAVIAAVSIVIGTVLAIAQTDLKRMLAYSGVAQAGYILTGVVAGIDGIPAMWFYLATYTVQLVGAFGIAAIVSGPRGGPSALSEYSQLYSRAPLLATGLAALMLAMGGIPGTAGFIGKLAVFSAAADGDFLWLVVIGVVAAAAGLWVYLRVIVVMFFQRDSLATLDVAGSPLQIPLLGRVVVVVTIAATVLLGIVPWPLLNLVQHALPL